MTFMGKTTAGRHQNERNCYLFHSQSKDGLVDCDKLGAVGKGGFDLNVRNHLGNAIHHIGPV